MADEDASLPIETASAPPEDGGADDMIDSEDVGAREAYLAECQSMEEDDVDAEGGEEVFPLETKENPVPTASGGLASRFAKTERSIGPHLDELRKRLLLSVVAFAPAFAVGLWLCGYLWDALLLPLADASPHLMRFQALSPSDGLLLMMRIAFAFALIVSMPVWLAQVWSFIAPGLTASEKRWLYLALGSGSILFFAGVLTAYFGGVPLALGYLLPLNQSLTGWENAFTGAGYVDFIVTCCLGFGLAFETPLVMLVLGWTGLITPAGIRSWWRFAVLCIFVLAAVMTPPDPFSQLMLAVPMLGLFSLGYLLVVWAHKRR